MKKVCFLAMFALGFSAFNAHADKYEDCMIEAGKIGDSALAKCMNERTKELMGDLKTIYEASVKENAFRKWNSGNEMKSGNFRTMFDSWINYRDKYCSVYTISMSEYMGSDEYNYADCMLKETEEHVRSIRALTVNINSSLAYE